MSDWERTMDLRWVERQPFDPMIAADLSRARMYGPVEDQPVALPPKSALVLQQAWRRGAEVEWRDVPILQGM